MSIRVRWFVLAAIVAIGLGISHYVCYRRGQVEELAELIPAIQREKKHFAVSHLIFALRALSPVAQHPDAIPATDAAELCRQVEEYCREIEQERLPELHEMGNEDRARRYEKLIREARTLIGSIQR